VEKKSGAPGKENLRNREKPGGGNSRALGVQREILDSGFIRKESRRTSREMVSSYVGDYGLNRLGAESSSTNSYSTLCGREGSKGSSSNGKSALVRKERGEGTHCIESARVYDRLKSRWVVKKKKKDKNNRAQTPILRRFGKSEVGAWGGGPTHDISITRERKALPQRNDSSQLPLELGGIAIMEVKTRKVLQGWPSNRTRGNASAAKED